MMSERQPSENAPSEPQRRFPTRPDYVRVATLGDSATFGLGDRSADGQPRGWARLLAGSIATDHHMSLCNLAVSGAIIKAVRAHQLIPAIEHSPHIASLVVGINDVLRSDWDPESAHQDLMACGSALARSGALLLTPRFHNHGTILGLPRILQRPLLRRIDELNAIYDEVDDCFGTLRLDLAATPLADDRRYWTLDRMHPSELGHRYIAHMISRMLNAEGLYFPLPSLDVEQPHIHRRTERRELLTQGAPWIARRTRDLAPWAARRGLARLAPRLAS